MALPAVMNTSTEGVTLYYGFILDLLKCYEKNREGFAKGLFEMAPSLDSDDPTQPVPMQLYDDMCQWIEVNIGKASVSTAGRAIGSRAYDYMIQTKAISESPTPLEILKGLKKAASVMIQDPMGREWEIMEANEGSITIRRTQTFNCILQEGLLKSLIMRAEVMVPQAEHVACVREGAEFCDYKVTWMT